MKLSKKKNIESQLDPCERPSLTKGWKKLSESLDHIFVDKCYKLNFFENSFIVYNLCSYGRTNELLEALLKKFTVYFQDFLKNALKSYDMNSPNAPELAKDYILKTGVILPRFETIAQSLCSIFIHISQFRGNFDLREKLHQGFISIIESEDCYLYIFNSICCLFDIFLNEYSIDAIEQEPLFNSVKQTKSLISYASPGKLVTMKNMITRQCELYFKNFVTNYYQQLIPPPFFQEEKGGDSDESSEDTSIFAGTGRIIAEEKPVFDPLPHIEKYFSEVTSLVEFEYFMAVKVFDIELATSLKKIATVETSDPNTETLKYCLENIDGFLKKRQFDVLKKIYCILSPTIAGIDILCQCICNSISTESNKIGDLMEILNFYKKISKELFTRKENQEMIHKSLTKLVNSDWKALLKEMLRIINQAALTDADISNLLPILSLFQMKTDFELMHIRIVAKRLTKKMADQIDNEMEILEQLRSVNPPLQLESLQSLINSAAKSISENHYGPVLILNASMWPYKPPYPSPIALCDITSHISTKYVEAHRTAELHFPINYWIVNVKDTLSSVVYSGTGVQAEVLLYLNDHKIISETSLEPRISHSFLNAALKSMVHKAAPVLKVKEGVYSLNEKWRSREKIVKLKQPAYKDELQTAKDSEKSKGDMIEAAVIKKMKERRIMSFMDIDQYVKEELHSKVPVCTDEIKKHIDILINKEYLEEMSSGKLAYVP